MKSIVGNLITDALQGTLDGHIIHGCNAQGGMGAGIALEVKNRIPQAYDAYMKVHNETGLSLGMAIPVRLHQHAVFWNLITQEFYGRDDTKYVSYDAIDDALRLMRAKIDSRNNSDIPKKLYFPLIGCGLANGNWSVVSSIINVHFSDYETTLYTLTKSQHV